MTNTLYDALIAPHKNNDAPFLVDDSGTTISYAAFIARVAQVAHVLSDIGVKPGDRVLVQAPKLTDTIALYAATLQVGAVYLPLNTGYTQSEVSYFIADAAPALVVCDEQDKAEMSTLCNADTSVLTLSTTGQGSLSLKAHTSAHVFDTVPREPDDLAALLYTSGTTGRAKGAMLSHKNLLSNAQTLTVFWDITAADRLLHALPIFHTHGLFVALNTLLLAGGQVRLMAAFDVGQIISDLPSCTVLMGVPTFYTRLLAEQQFTRDKVAKMRLFISGSAPLLEETHAEFAARTGHHILERYGMTETNMITSNPYEGSRIAGTVGYPLPGTEVVITDAGVAVPVGDIGMIEVRGDHVFQGYWNMPDKTAQEMRDTGFFITGDLGVQAADGRISIVGRQKDLIISGGYNIYPKEVEDEINAVAGVQESAVFGLPHSDLGETVIAAVVLDEATLRTDDIAKQIAPRLARFKQPRQYYVLDALPRNTMGKVQKNMLRAQFSD